MLCGAWLVGRRLRSIELFTSAPSNLATAVTTSRNVVLTFAYDQLIALRGHQIQSSTATFSTVGGASTTLDVRNGPSVAFTVAAPGNPLPDGPVRFVLNIRNNNGQLVDVISASRAKKQMRIGACTVRGVEVGHA